MEFPHKPPKEWTRTPYAVYFKYTISTESPQTDKIHSNFVSYLKGKLNHYPVDNDDIERYTYDSMPYPEKYPSSQKRIMKWSMFYNDYIQNKMVILWMLT